MRNQNFQHFYKHKNNTMKERVKESTICLNMLFTQFTHAGMSWLYYSCTQPILHLVSDTLQVKTLLSMPRLP